MYPTSEPSNPGLQTHAAQLRTDATGDIFRSLEESLQEAIALSSASSGSGRAEGAHGAASRLDSAFEAAEKILMTARSIRRHRP